MYRFFLARFFVLLFVFLVPQIGAVDVVKVNKNTDKINLSPNSEIFLDSEDYFKYEDVSQEIFNENFTSVESKSVSAGYTSDVIWIRFKISNEEYQPFKAKLEIPIPWISELDFYIKTDEELIVKKLGANFTFIERDISSRSFFIPITIEPKQTTTVYIKAQGSDAITLAPYLYSEKESTKRLSYIAVFSGVLIGMILIMIIYHLNRYIVLKDDNYLYFILYLTGLVFFMGIYYGYNAQFFWTESPVLNERISFPIVAFSFFTGLLFSRNFLNTSKNFPKSDRYLTVLMYSFIPLGIFSFFVDSKLTMFYFTSFFAFLYSIGLIYISVRSFKKKISGSTDFLLAWSLSSFSLFLSSMMLQGFIDYSHFLYEFHAPIVILHILLLSFALVSRSNDMRTQKEIEIEKEHKIADSLGKSKEKLIRLNEKLERKIAMQEAQLSQRDEEYEKYSTKDKLTQLYNRAKLEELLANELHRSKRYLDDFSLIIINIDNMGSINDKHSFQVGDSVIKELADILIKNIRYIDTVGRWSESEYLIICPKTNAKQAQIASKHIQEVIENYKFFFVGKVTVSFGVTACLPTDSGQDIIARVFDALATAKENGKNRIEVI
ncbi:diguanylate cyclase [Sulfurimonas sp.]|uniref:diguanylate cyclase n=1 Tax=Sulfurimonas sp. TaxID=2022749 RepID=UPI002614B5CA|nr:diguanylate cyclase [Sulfurimonas sp.]MCW8895044.1 diguanylate cyclase [Sulfurimonas sp.]MCW9067337.1 diguanylate cyclase [Sulfurimonas sp.]